MINKLSSSSCCLSLCVYCTSRVLANSCGQQEVWSHLRYQLTTGTDVIDDLLKSRRSCQESVPVVVVVPYLLILIFFMSTSVYPRGLAATSVISPLIHLRSWSNTNSRPTAGSWWWWGRRRCCRSHCCSPHRDFSRLPPGIPVTAAHHTGTYPCFHRVPNTSAHHKAAAR